MKIELFVDTYETKKRTTSGDEFIQEHITTEYVPFEKKCALAEAIIDAAYYQDVNSGDGETSRELYVNSRSRYVLTCMTVVDLYTDIERDKVGSNIVADFNMLNKSGLIDKIIGAVPEREIKELNMVVEMTAEDTLTNEYEPHAFIRSQVTRFGTLIGASLAPVLEAINWQEAESKLRQLAEEKLK